MTSAHGWNRLRTAAGLLAALAIGPASAQLSVDVPSGDGYVNPSDTSWRYYLEQMDRFPDRIGFVCMNGYELNKTGDHRDGLMFMTECARRGNAPSMIYLAQMYTDGLGVPRDPRLAAAWLKRAADKGYSVAQYHYGVALLLGEGVDRDHVAARDWLQRAAGQGDEDARALIGSGLDSELARSRGPVHRGPEPASR